MATVGRILVGALRPLIPLRVPAPVWLAALVSLTAPIATGSPGHAADDAAAVTPEGTAPLVHEGDLASDMVAGIDRFLTAELQQMPERRRRHWELPMDSSDAWTNALAPHRRELARCLGLRDVRWPAAVPELIATIDAVDHELPCGGFQVRRVRWPVLADPAPTGTQLPSIYGEGLLLLPDGAIVADVIAIPDADQTPEQIAGLQDDLPVAARFAAAMARRGCRVLIPTLVSRTMEKRHGRALLSGREYLHRSAFELGRTLAGYELQKVLSGVDWYAADSESRPISVVGYGEGGFIALCAGALDDRIDAVGVSGCFSPVDDVRTQPMDRNFFGVLKTFSIEELAMMVAPRTLVFEAGNGPEVVLPGDGGAPSRLQPTDVAAVQAMVSSALGRLQPLATAAGGTLPLHVVACEPTQCGHPETLERLFGAASGTPGNSVPPVLTPEQELTFGAAAQEQRQVRILQETDRHNQALLRESPFVREQFLNKLDLTSMDTFQRSVEAYRTTFRQDVIGEFDQPLLPFNARARRSWDMPKWTGYEVVLDVFPDVFAYGVLLIPKDMQPGERRPVVVCQHGLEGRPTDTLLNDHPAYHDFAAKLCEQGFVTFAPQNPYIFQDRFRVLQRMAQPMGCSLFSVIVPQHQQIVNWLKTQSFVDPDRIAFYGLSYGGKSAMRIPALVTDYCLSICSADFNEWVLKNASSRHPFSYVWTGEYEIFEWDLGSTFDYAEMATLICPRPFMVERGHFDGVGTDEWVAHEYAKVRHLYAARLGIGERTEIEWFVGPHTINGEGTYRFLRRHLHWGPENPPPVP